MKTKRPYAQVMPIAEKLADRLSARCERIEIAGSLRRQCETVGDIEIVAIPMLQLDLFGNVDDSIATPLDTYLNSLMMTGHIRHTAHKRWGAKLKSFLFTTTMGGDYQVDLFLQPDPATWGVNMMVRTGSAEFSKRMVTQRSKGGWMPDGMYQRDAQLWRDGEVLDTPEERDVFEAIGKEWVEPKERNA